MTDSISGNQGPSYQSYSSSSNQDQASQQFQTFLKDHPTSQYTLDQLNEHLQNLNSGDCQKDSSSARSASQYFSDLITDMGTHAPNMILSTDLKPKLEALKSALDNNDQLKRTSSAIALSEHIADIMQGKPPDALAFYLASIPERW